MTDLRFCCKYIIYIDSLNECVCDTFCIYKRRDLQKKIFHNFTQNYISAVTNAITAAADYIFHNFNIRHTPDYNDFIFDNEIKSYNNSLVVIDGKSVSFAALITYIAYVFKIPVPENTVFSGVLNEHGKIERIEYNIEKIKFIEEERADIEKIIIPAANTISLTKKEIIRVTSVSELIESVFDKRLLKSNIINVEHNSRHYIEQQNIIADKTAVFIGRTETINEINSFIDKNDSGFILLAGMPGAGKSALAAYLTANRNYPRFFFNSSKSGALLSTALLSLTEQLCSKYRFIPKTSANEIEIENNYYYVINRVSAQITSANGNKEVIVIDGLENINTADLSSVFPFGDIPKNIFFLVSLRKTDLYFELKRMFYDKKNFLDIELKFFDINETRSLFDNYNIELIDDELSMIFQKTNGSPLFLNAIIKNINTFKEKQFSRLPDTIYNFFEYTVRQSKIIDDEYSFAILKIMCLLYEPVN
nr:hypothetical protein [Candidatus Dependentiae bacterium]